MIRTMNKEIKVLYTIFELELTPPIGRKNLVHDGYVCDKHGRKIAWYMVDTKELMMSTSITKSLLNKIKQTFNVETLSNNDVFHIKKHLDAWMRDNLLEEFNVITIQNMDTTSWL